MKALWSLKALWSVWSLGAAGAVVAAAGLPCTGTSALAVAAVRLEAGKVRAVGAESQYANVISQIGGRYVSVSAVVDNPTTDPHEFEASARVAEQVSGAALVVQNGAGYDTFMDKIEQAGHVPGRRVVVAQQVTGRRADGQNPHLWYDPRTMPAVAAAIAADLEQLRPSHRSYFRLNLRRFDRSLGRWRSQLAAFRAAHLGAAVAVTEPVADYMLQAAGARILTPLPLQLSIMDGTDPSPQDISRQTRLLSTGRVKALLYNEQVADSLTTTFLTVAKEHHVPVVAVYETMPAPGYDYQTWMQAETEALARAVSNGTSTEKL